MQTMIKEKLKVLLIEDKQNDMMLIKRQIHKTAPNAQVTHVYLRQDILNELKKGHLDIIISDYNLPTIDGMEILKLARQESPMTTFVFVTGTLNDEELAADTILGGASGFILKKHINELHKKLHPYFKAVADNGITLNPAKKRIMQSKKLVRDIENFLANFSKENSLHQEGMDKIKNDLLALRQKYNAKTTENTDD